MVGGLWWAWQDRRMAETVRNRRATGELLEGDVEQALARLEGRDGGEARHVYETLTWGEGPARISREVVQHWLWWQLPTKYLTDEVGYMGRLAGLAGDFFEELGLDGYAAICRSETTAGVHAAFERSRSAGVTAMRRAQSGSGIDPPDVAGLLWGEVMGMEEALARSVAAGELERAIDEGELAVGARGWRARQQEIVSRLLDSDRPSAPGQSWRTVIVTERIGTWVDGATRRSPDLGRMRATVANRLLHPVDPPEGVADRMEPLAWLLEVFGAEQALTQAGYLNRPFLLEVHGQRPWRDPIGADKPPRTQSDEIILTRLRELLEAVGAWRKHKRVLRRTAKGQAMAADPVAAWSALVDGLAAQPWEAFVAETVGLVLVDRGGSAGAGEVLAAVGAMAADYGWRTGSEGDQEAPERQAVSWAFSDARALLELFGMLEESGDWRDRRWTLTAAGETTMLAVLRASAVGPRKQPW
jgi:hypothetical protein